MLEAEDGIGCVILFIAGLVMTFMIPVYVSIPLLQGVALVSYALVINFFLTTFEAKFLSRRYQLHYQTVYLYSVLANIGSMIAILSICSTIELCSPLIAPFEAFILGDRPLNHLVLLLSILWFSGFILLSLLKFPFYCHAFQRDRKEKIDREEAYDERQYRWFSMTSLILLTQVISYVMLSLYFTLFSSIGIFRNARIVNRLDFAKNPKSYVYYWNGYDDYRVRLDGSIPEKLSDRREVGRIRRRILDAYHKTTPIQDEAFPEERSFAIDLRPKRMQQWEAGTGFYDTPNIVFHNRQIPQDFAVGICLLYFEWMASNTTILPGDQVVFQLGPQIVLFDIHSRKLAFVALGDHPLVVLK